MARRAFSSTTRATSSRSRDASEIDDGLAVLDAALRHDRAGSRGDGLEVHDWGRAVWMSAGSAGFATIPSSVSAAALLAHARRETTREDVLVVVPACRDVVRHFEARRPNQRAHLVGLNDGDAVSPAARKVVPLAIRVVAIPKSPTPRSPARSTAPHRAPARSRVRPLGACPRPRVPPW